MCLGPSAEQQNEQATSEFNKRLDAVKQQQKAAGMIQFTDPSGGYSVPDIKKPEFETKARADVDRAMTEAKNRSVAQFGGAKLGPAAQAQSATLGPAAQVGIPQGVNAANIANAETAQSRQMQLGALGQLAGQAAGTTPSAATAAAERQGERMLAQQNALLASRGAGANVGAALAGIRRSGEEGRLNLAADLQANKIAEQQQAQQAFANALQGFRGADIGQATSQAGLAQQAALSNQDATLRAELANMDATNQFGLQQGAFDQATNLANTAATNQFGLQQGAFDQAAGLAGMDAVNANNSQLNSLGLSGAGLLADLGQAQALAGYNTDIQNRDARSNTLGMQLAAAGGKEGMAYNPIMTEANRGYQLAGGLMSAGGAIGAGFAKGG